MIDIKPKIKIEIWPDDPDRRNFHLTSEISCAHLEHFKRPLQDNDIDWSEIGGVGRLLLEEIFALGGVMEVFIQSYELGVIKGSAFDWEYLQPGIIQALKRTFGSAEESVEITEFTDEAGASKDNELIDEALQ